jgi:hypothetical protein
MNGYELVVILLRELWNDNHIYTALTTPAPKSTSPAKCARSLRRLRYVQGVLLMIVNVTEHPICRFG